MLSCCFPRASNQDACIPGGAFFEKFIRMRIPTPTWRFMTVCRSALGANDGVGGGYYLLCLSLTSVISTGRRRVYGAVFATKEDGKLVRSLFRRFLRDSIHRSKDECEVVVEIGVLGVKAPAAAKSRTYQQ